MRPMRQAQRGAALLEAMVALVIFSFGILGLVGLQAVAIKNAGDAKYRADASFLANQIIAQMWADNPINPAALAKYNHNPGAGALCAPGGAATTDANTLAWLTQVNAVLPGAAAAKQQIAVNAATSQVTVTVCWRANQDPNDHNHVVTAQVRTN